jgi:hypothetical protein
MNTKSLKLLRIGAMALGWLLVAGVLAGIWGRLVIYCRGKNDPTAFLRSVVQFDIVNALNSFFSGFGDAFFAFLIAAVFCMIEKQAPVGNENAKRLMIVCCLSYVADALVRFYSLILNLTLTLQSAKGFEWLHQSSSTAITALIPILYSASIFVLYTHFTKMVMFESEVA